MRYVLLLRDVNVGGKNKVVMADLKNNLEVMGYTHVKSYINSGNVFFNSEDAVEDMNENIHTHFSHTYDFELLFVILGADEFIQEYHNLPEWWQDDFARKDVLFYTDSIDKAALRQTIEIESGEIYQYEKLLYAPGGAPKWMMGWRVSVS